VLAVLDACRASERWQCGGAVQLAPLTATQRHSLLTGMARNFNTAVSTLTSVADEQLRNADDQLAAAHSWLQGLVETARQAIAECAPPPAKRQRATRSKAKATKDGKVSNASCARMHHSSICLSAQLSVTSVGT
jgi:hypothetical protein